MKTKILKATAGGVVCGSAYYLISRFISPKQPDISETKVFEYLDEEYSVILQTNDPELFNLMERLSMFRKFDSESYDQVVQASARLVATYLMAEENPNMKTVSYAAGFGSQMVEGIRRLRAYLRHTYTGSGIKTLIEDFDDIASNVQSIINNYSHNISLAVDTNLTKNKV